MSQARKPPWALCEGLQQAVEGEGGAEKKEEEKVEESEFDAEGEREERGRKAEVSGCNGRTGRVAGAYIRQQ